MSAPLPISEKGTTGRVTAHFDAPGARTRLAHLACVAPLKVAKPFPQPDGSLHVCLMDVSPGLLAGDHYELQWRLDTGAQVLVTHQGFMRVHPSKDSPTTHHQSISLASGALLEYEAAPILLYRDATLNARTKIEVEQGGTLILSDIICAGRTNHNELFAFDHYHGHLQARYAGELVAWSSTELNPQLHNLSARGAWDQRTHYGTILIVSENASKPLQDTLRTELRSLEEQYHAAGVTLRGGIALADRHAVTISLLGQRAHDIEQAAKRLRACAHFFLIQECSL